MENGAYIDDNIVLLMAENYYQDYVKKVIMKK